MGADTIDDGISSYRKKDGIASPSPFLSPAVRHRLDEFFILKPAPKTDPLLIGVLVTAQLLSAP